MPELCEGLERFGRRRLEHCRRAASCVFAPGYMLVTDLLK
jgi:hypothetical protein